MLLDECGRHDIKSNGWLWTDQISLKIHLYRRFHKGWETLRNLTKNGSLKTPDERLQLISEKSKKMTLFVGSVLPTVLSS